ncbi:hypothetical protein EPN54_03230 [bacterium]|nr:MAG: hypothetical protein EPN54_03230 [bacterium]
MALKKKKKVRKAAKKPAKKTSRKPVKKAAKKAAGRKPLLKKKPAARKRPAAKKVIKKEEGNLIGSITHYFPHVQAAVIKLKGPLAIGETVKIKGHTTDLTQTITSMQIDRVDISSAKKGDEIGLLVNSRVRQHDKVYKL